MVRRAKDDTARLQAAIDQCSDGVRRVLLPSGAVCLSQPLLLRSHTTLFIAARATLKAGAKWLSTPFLYAANATDLTVEGNGTIDGSGEQWWPRNGSKPAGRPHLVRFDNVSRVQLRNLTLLNAAEHFTYLGGRDYVIHGLTIRSPPFHTSPNTDGINLRAHGVHVSGCDITNGDDSVVLKAPSSDVLVEDTTVRQGNGLVVGTSDNAFFRNITFRNCTAEGTMFGCHIKFKDAQNGSVAGVTFEDIRVLHPTNYAIGINQDGQSMASPPLRSNVSIVNVSFVRITGVAPRAGRFRCNPGAFRCRGIRLEHIHIDVPAGAPNATGCTFENTVGSGVDVSPSSCVPPLED